MRAYKTAVIARRTGPPSGFLASAVEVFADAAIAELEAENEQLRAALSIAQEGSRWLLI
jgi:hypothetical protein